MNIIEPAKVGALLLSLVITLSLAQVALASAQMAEPQEVAPTATQIAPGPMRAVIAPQLRLQEQEINAGAQLVVKVLTSLSLTETNVRPSVTDVASANILVPLEGAIVRVFTAPVVTNTGDYVFNPDATRTGAFVLQRTTNENGMAFFNLDPGKYRITVSKEGYTGHQRVVEVEVGADGTTTTVSVVLIREANEPPTVIPITRQADGGRVIEAVLEVNKEPVNVLPALVKPTTAAQQQVAMPVSIKPINAEQVAVESGVGEITAIARNINFEIEDQKLYAIAIDAVTATPIKKQISVLPDVAVKGALAVSNLPITTPVDETTLEVINEQPTYVVKYRQNANLLGFIPTEVPVVTKISADTAEYVVEKPWWAFLAF